jgi:hypothetical protein
MNKRFLVPVLALAGFGLPVGASIVTYCDGGGCGANITSAFNNAVATNGYTYVSVSNISFTAGSLSGTQYDDGLTSMVFLDSSHPFSVNSGELDTSSAGNDSVTITVPATYSAIVLDLTNFNSGTVGFGLDQGSNFANLAHGSTTVVGYTNVGGSAPWTITIYPFSSSGALGIINFNAAMSGSTGGETPEVGTLLLIGFGLIAMRWMRRWPRRLFRVPQTA